MLLQKGRTEKIEQLEKASTMTQKHIEQYQKDLEGFNNDSTLNESERQAKSHALIDRISSAERSLANMKNEISSIRSQLNFFDTVYNALKNLVPQTCLICFETVGENQSVAITPCAHIHCVTCMQALLNSSSRCSMCRQPISSTNVKNVLLKRSEPPAPAEPEETAKSDDEVDISQYGSKLAAFVKYLEKTIEEQPDAKLILFVQFRRLMGLVSKALKNFNIDNVRCEGNVFQRNHAIRTFKTSDKVRLILLSSEDSVSGLHLVEATHVVIFHPFMVGSDTLAIAYEKQGIARAWRGGQTKQVKLVRFLTRDTIEEEMARKRQYAGLTTTE